MGLVDRLLKEAMENKPKLDLGDVEKTASSEIETEGSVETLASEIEKLAHSGEVPGGSAPVEKILESAAVYEALTGENFLERVKI